MSYKYSWHNCLALNANPKHRCLVSANSQGTNVDWIMQQNPKSIEYKHYTYACLREVTTILYKTSLALSSISPHLNCSLVQLNLGHNNISFWASYVRQCVEVSGSYSSIYPVYQPHLYQTFCATTLQNLVYNVIISNSILF